MSQQEDKGQAFYKPAPCTNMETRAACLNSFSACGQATRSGHVALNALLRALLAILNSRFPVVRPTGVMCEGKDGDAVGIGPIYDSKRKVLQKDLPSVFGRGRAGERKGKGPSRCVLDSRSETRAKSRFFLVVVEDFGQKLAPRCRDESGVLHRVRRRASAKTSSAA